MTGNIIFGSNGRLEYSSTHWITPRDSYGNTHLNATNGGIYLDSTTVYIREAGATTNYSRFDNGSIVATGTITATGGNSTNWNTAHGWGNHASAGYGTASAVAANTAKTGITSGQASAITANSAKTGITSGQASAITANSAKTGITSGQASAITANTTAVATKMATSFLDSAEINFTVGGNADTYYPVSIQGGGHYAYQMYSISRHYAATAPSTWNTSSHKGGLTLTWQFSGDGFWGGNDHDIRIIKFDENYSTMVMGMGGSVGGGGTNAGVVVWLRGGTASYTFHGPQGSTGDVNVHLTSVTASNGSVFAPRSFNSTTRDNEINPKYPIRGISNLYDNNNRVWHAGNDGAGTGLDADLLDGNHASAFMGQYGIPANNDVYVNFRVIRNQNTSSANDGMYIGYGNTNSGQTRIFGGGSTGVHLAINATNMAFNNNAVWHAGNDGAGSGLDADKLDGQEGSYYGTASAVSANTAKTGITTSQSSAITSNTTAIATKLPLSGGTLTGTLNSRDVKLGSGYHLMRSSHHTGHLEGSFNNIGNNGAKSNPIYTIGSAYNPADASLSDMYGIGYTYAGSASFISMTGASGWGMYVAGNGAARVFLDGSNGVISSTGQHYVGSNVVWNAGNDGAGTGLDADKLDGQHGSYYGTASAVSANTAKVGISTSQAAAITANTTAIATKASLSGSNSFTNSYNEFGNSTGNVSNDGSWNGRLNVAGSSHARLDVKSVSDGIITTMYSHTGHAAGRIGTMSNHKLTLMIAGNEKATLNTNGTFYLGSNVVWNAGNDGASSGLDADKLDGQHGSYYGTASAVATNTAKVGISTSQSSAITANTTAIATKLPKSGGTLTGQVNIDYGSPKFIVGSTSNLDTSDSNRPNITLNGGMYPHMTIDARVDGSGNPSSNLTHGPVFSFVSRLGTSGYRRWGIATAAKDAGALSFGYYDNQANPHYSSGGNAGYTGTGSKMWLATTGILSTSYQGVLWGASNDGASSGLDADKLDGQHGSYYGTASAVSANTAKVGISTSQASAITANTTAIATKLGVSAKAADSNLLDGYNSEEGAVANSIVKRDGTASIKAYGLSLLRASVARTGITWYNEAYYNWQDYMAAAGATGCAPNGNLTAPTGLAGVTSWALRSRMEGVASYGWNWETGSSGGGGATATSKMSLNATTGNLEIAGTFTAPTIKVGDGTDGRFFSDTAGRTAFGDGNFYIQTTVANYYNYATNQYHGNSSGDNHYFRGNPLSGNNWSITAAGVITAAGGNSGNWNTAYGWGNHASAGYGTASAVAANTAKVGISTSQSSAITANSAKTGISTSQSSAITANSSKLAGIEAGATADQTAAQILASIKTVDVNGTSGINAGTLDGYTLSTGTAANTVVQRQANGYIHAVYFNATGTFGTSANSSGMGRFTGTNGSDTYGRSYTAAAARTLLNVANGANNYVLPTTISGTRNFSGKLSTTGSDTGIGTSNPTELLHVRKAQSTSAATNPFIKLHPTSTTNSTGVTSIFLSTTTASGAYGISLNGWRDPTDSEAFAIKTHAGSANGTNRLVIRKNGYIGIGTDSPSSKLQVNGTLTATTKNFLIDNPKTGGELQYSVIESNEHGVCVRGESDQEDVQLPIEWEWLVHEDSVTVQLTSVGQAQSLFVLERNNVSVKIGGLATGGKYSYVIYGTRKDVEPLEVNI